MKLDLPFCLLQLLPLSTIGYLVEGIIHLGWLPTSLCFGAGERVLGSRALVELIRSVIEGLLGGPTVDSGLDPSRLSDCNLFDS